MLRTWLHRTVYFVKFASAEAPVCSRDARWLRNSANRTRRKANPEFVMPDNALANFFRESRGVDELFPTGKGLWKCSHYRAEDRPGIAYIRTLRWRRRQTCQPDTRPRLPGIGIGAS